MHPISASPVGASSFAHPRTHSGKRRPHSDGQHRARAKWAGSRGATPTQRHVLLAIAVHQDKQGEAFPSLATLVEMTGYSVPTVREAIAALQALGLLAVLRPPTPRRVTLYRVSVPPKTELMESESGFQSEGKPVAPKDPFKNQEEIKTAGAQAPARGAQSVPELPRPAPPRSVNPEPAPIQSRAQKSAANKLAHRERRRAKAIPPSAPREPYKPYQLPLPEGPLVNQWTPDQRAEYFRQARARIGIASSQAATVSPCPTNSPSPSVRSAGN